MDIDGFDWDDGNWPKCGRHGLSRDAIEETLRGDLTVFDDPHDPDHERRFRAIGRDDAGRHVFVVFCIRAKDEAQLIRPISARYMRRKEVDHYERQKA